MGARAVRVKVEGGEDTEVGSEGEGEDMGAGAGPRVGWEARRLKVISNTR